jgi:threonine/homoserine/homoserine lactone efflux protein
MTAPLVMDALVMLPLGLFLQASIFSGKGSVALILLGGALLVWLGFQSIRAGTFIPHPSSFIPTTSQEFPSFIKGVLTHITSPFPYLYWGSVGSSLIRQGFESGGLYGAVIFPFGFWLGASIFSLLVIYVLARGKKLLPHRMEPYLHHFSGALLIGSGLYLAVSAWRSFFF